MLPSYLQIYTAFFEDPQTVLIHLGLHEMV
jgi:hypothetical protein